MIEGTQSKFQLSSLTQKWGTLKYVESNGDEWNIRELFYMHFSKFW